ncbi:MAG: creatininase family protein, partial [Microvirga sp.]
LEKFGAAHRDCRIVFLTWWRMAADDLSKIQESGFGGVGHACEFETSIMMHGVPNSVREGLIAGQNYVPTYHWADSDMMTAGRAGLFRTVKAMSNGTGVLGDPSLASPGKGARITEAVVGRLAAIVQDLRADPPSVSSGVR